MRKQLATFAVGLMVVTAVSSTAEAHGQRYTPGAAGIGDPYFPFAGNGGYDVKHYDLEVTYDPETDFLSGRATIEARATQNLSSFNLDLDGLEVHRVKVDGSTVEFSRDGSELTIVPKRGISKGTKFEVVVTYDGVPRTLEDLFGISGFIHTDDGTLVAGQPFGAATWYPVNDHPLDTASYDFSIKVPAGLEAIANGVLTDSRTRHGWTTWKWSAKEPMASYLTTMTIGEFDLRAYKSGRLKFWDAVDPNLFDPVAVPHTGDQVAISGQGDDTYKRLARTLTVPTDGDHLMSFWVNRDTEFNFDFFFVEVHHTGLEDWTTLPEASGITEADDGTVCAYLLDPNPFLAHYQERIDEETCATTGTTGDWHAASGSSEGYELWTIDLTEYAGEEIEVSLAYVSDFTVQGGGVVIDDITMPGGPGTTSFEDDGDELDDWVVLGPPEGSPANSTDWFVGTAADGPPPQGLVVDAAFARQPEILDFLGGFFGRYPFSAAGGIVDDFADIGFALETQTRPVYARVFFGNQIDADSVVVHENAHQWFGDNLPLAGWQDIWLNEGFATYAEWLWSEHEGLGTPDDLFNFYMAVIPPEDPFWTVTIGDPTPEFLFDISVYYRGAMTLQALRREVGDDDFFKILRTWATTKAGENVSIPQFIRHAERISHQDLDALFETWLYTPSKPELPAQATATARVASTQSVVAAPSALGRLLGSGRNLKK